MASTTFTFNPSAAGFAENPYPHYAELRAISPVYEHPLGFWIVSRYEDVSRLQRSAHSVDEQDLTRLPVWRSDSGTLGKENRMMRGLAVLDQNPPNHTRLRRLIGKAFTRSAVQAMRPRVEALVDGALDQIAAEGRADVVAELAFPLPFTVISEMLGMPETVRARIRDLTGTLARGMEPMADPSLQAAIRAANEELESMIRRLTAWKRAHPSDDLFSALISAADGTDALTEDEVMAQVMFMYLAGHETTVNHLATGIYSLLRHPDQFRLLQREPELTGNAVEELLRYEPPVHVMRRITVEPLTVQGTVIPAGNWVVAELAAANRDPGFWGPDAEELRLGRPNARQHVSLGGGIHHCLGAPLARLEAEVTFAKFARRFPSSAVLDARWNGRINARGLDTLVIDVR